jgi:pentatricopeptide repeat protein
LWGTHVSGIARVELAESFLAVAFDIVIVAMNTVLHCWTKCKSEDAAARAHAMLTNMRDLSHAGDVDFAPDRISYNTVINAWAKAGKEYHAIALLEEMNHEHARGKMELKPDRTTYATVLSSFLHSKSVDSARQAEEFLNQMPTLGVQPDVICYNIVLECYAKSDDPKAAERAEALLQEMTDPLKHDTKISPDVVSYSSVLKAWSTSPDRKAPESAEAHFKELLSIYKGGNKSMKPDDRCFLAMITVWSKCRRSCAGTKAEEYLRLMLEINPFDKSGHRRLKAHYNCAIRAWAFSQVSEGVSRAEALLREMLDLAEAGNQDIMPDGTSCGWLLKTIAMSKVTDKTKKADQVMEIMAQHGLKLDSFGKRYLERCRKK